MTANDLSRTSLPLEQEVQAAAKGQRALAAGLAGLRSLRSDAP